MSLGGKQTFSNDEKSCKKRHCLAKVHLCAFTQHHSCIIWSQGDGPGHPAMQSHSYLPIWFSSGLVARCNSQSNHLHVSATSVTHASAAVVNIWWLFKGFLCNSHMNFISSIFHIHYISLCADSMKHYTRPELHGQAVYHDITSVGIL